MPTRYPLADSWPMKPGVYFHCLEMMAERDGLDQCDLHPVMIAEIEAVEQELNLELPVQYEEFLIEVGAGEEHGGLGAWFHLDLSRSGNLLNANAQLKGLDIAPPGNFWAIYEARGDGVFGFLAGKGGCFQPQVLMWDRESDELETVAQDLYGFLDENADCSEHERESAEKRYLHSKQRSKPQR